MGIRIHTTIGYGFKYIRWGKDPRFNESFWDWGANEKDIKPTLLDFCLARKDNHDDWGYDLAFFSAWLEGKGLYEKHGAPETLSLTDFIDYSGFGPEMKRCPLIFGNYEKDKDWRRRDNIIDYYQSGKEPLDKVSFITDELGQPAGIYPNSLYCHRNNGRLLKGIYPAHRWSVDFRDLNPEWGIENELDWQRNVMPLVPADIRAVCEVCNVFKNPLTVFRLRAMIYSYWS